MADSPAFRRPQHEQTLTRVGNVLRTRRRAPNDGPTIRHELLRSLVARGCNDMLLAGDRVLVSAACDPEGAIRDLLRAYFDVFVNQNPDRGLAGVPAPSEMIGFDRRLMDQITELLTRFQHGERFHQHLPLGEAAFVIYCLLISMLIMYLESDERTSHQIREEVVASVGLLLQGWTRW